MPDADGKRSPDVLKLSTPGTFEPHMPTITHGSRRIRRATRGADARRAYNTHPGERDPRARRPAQDIP